MPVLTLDIETYYDDACTLRKLTYMEYIRHPDFELFGVGVAVDDEPSIWLRPDNLQSVLSSQQWDCIVGHNLTFDLTVLQALGYTWSTHRYFDTQGSARALFNTLLPSFSLETLSQRFLQTGKLDALEQVKGLHWSSLSTSLQDKLVKYCHRDVQLTRQLYRLLLPALPEEERVTLSHTTRMAVEPRLVLDAPLCHEVIQDAVTKRQELVAQTGLEEIELSSNNRFAQILSEYVDIPLKPSLSDPSKRIPALAKTDLEFQALAATGTHPHNTKPVTSESVERVKFLCLARLAVKSNIERTRAQRLLSDHNPHPRVFLQYAGALSSHRDAGTQKINFQNPPRKSKLRKALRASQGKQLLIIDSSNIELRSMFCLAGQHDKLDLIRAGEDLYKHAAASIYHLPVDQIDKKQRAVGKVQMLSLQYGSGLNKMRYIFEAGAMGPAIKLSEQEAQHVHSTYRRSNPHVPAFWKLMDEAIMCMARGTEWTYYFPGTDIPVFTTGFETMHLHFSGLNFNFRNLQHTPDGWQYMHQRFWVKIYGAMLTGRLNQSLARAVVFYQLNLIALRYPLLLRVHDEGWFEVPESEAKEALAYANACFRTNPPFVPDFLPLEGEGIITPFGAKP